MTFEEELKRHGGFVFTNVGDSMKPLIRQGRDLLEITARPEGRLKKYDIPLYRRDGRYILHRILKVRESDYIVAGDHNYRLELVTDAQIIGVLTGLTRDGKRISLSGTAYRVYLFFWCGLYPIRAVALYMLSLPRRIMMRTKNRKRKNTEGRR